MIRCYKGCVFEFFANEDYTWAVAITYPNDESEFAGWDFPNFDAAYLAATQCADLGLIANYSV